MIDTPMHIYEFGPFRVDALRRLLLREGNPVRLPAKAFEILLVLLEEKGRLVEKDELMRRVWPDAIVEENNLTVNMSALRRSLTAAGTSLWRTCGSMATNRRGKANKRWCPIK